MNEGTQHEQQISDAERAALLARHSRELSFLADAEGRLLHTSFSYRPLLGFEPHTLVGHNLFDYTHPDDAAALRRAWHTAQQSGEAGVVVRHRNARSAWRWVELLLARSDGSLVGVAHDITARVEAEHALRESQRLLQRIADATPEIWYLYDATLRRNIYANGGITTLLGYQEADLQAMMGRGVLATIMHPDDYAQLRERFARLSTSHDGEVVDSEYRVQHADGTWRWLWGRELVFARDDVGHPVQTLGIAQDITARKRAEQALRLLAEASSVLASSLEYELTIANVVRLALPTLADWCVVLLAGEESSLQPLAVAHTDSAREPALWQIAQQYGAEAGSLATISSVLTNGQPHLLTDLGVDRPPQSVAARLVREVGLRAVIVAPLIARERTLGVMIFALAEGGKQYSEADRELAQELARRAALAIDNARLYRDAQAALLARDNFLSVAAHELKTPITALLGHAQVLQRRATRANSLPERDQRALEVIANQSVRLSALIEDMLDLSRIRMGLFQLQSAPLELNDLVQRLVDEAQPSLEQHTVTGELPGEVLVIIGDALRLEQVLQNLLQNAIKYSPAGGAITVRLQRRDDHAVISVSDQGIGIAAAVLPQIFQQFYRASNAVTSALPGMGIGLYVVREIAAAHGGSVSAESTEGQGSTFTVALPLAPIPPATP